MPQSSVASYAAFLQFLLTIGPKLQVLWPKIQALIAAVTDLVGALKDATGQPQADGSLSEFAVSTTEAEMEAQLATRIAGPNAAFDGTILRGIWGFAQKHPELLTLLLSLLKGG